MFADLIESAGNLSIFFDSLKNYRRDLSVSGVVMTVLAAFMVVGLVDKMRGDKHGYGERFDAGFHAMGDLALAIVGIIAVSPVLLRLLAPIVTPVFRVFGISPAMFPGSLMALDMGGYAMSMQMAGGDAAIGNYAGIIVASMMGITFCFTIPYALTVIDRDDHNLFATGVLIGVVTLPVGCLSGGLAMAFTSTPIPFGTLLLNTLPVLVLALAVGVGLIFSPKRVIAIFQYLTGIRLPLFYLMVEEDPVLGGVPLLVALLLVGQIAVVLAGAFPMILFLNRRLDRLMTVFGSKAGVGKESSTGLLTQLASSIPIWSVLRDMDRRGKLLNVAFAVSGSFVFGDVLAFTGGVNPEMVFPAIVAKLTGGVLAVILALALLSREKAE